MRKVGTREKRSQTKAISVLPPQFQNILNKALSLLNDPEIFNHIQNKDSAASNVPKASHYGRIAVILRTIVIFADANSQRNQIIALNTIAGEIIACQKICSSEPFKHLLEDAIQLAIQTLILVTFHCSDLEGSVSTTALHALVKCVPNDVTFKNEIIGIKVMLQGRKNWIKPQFKTEITSWLNECDSNFSIFGLDKTQILDITKELDEGLTGEKYDWRYIEILSILNALFLLPEMESIFLESVEFAKSLLHLAIYIVQCHLDKSLLKHVTMLCGDDLCDMALKLSQNVMKWLIDNHYRLNNDPPMFTKFYVLGILCEIHYRKNDFSTAKYNAVGITIINTLLYPYFSSNVKCETLIRNSILDTSRWNEKECSGLNSLMYLKLLEAMINTPLASNAISLLLKDTSDSSLFYLLLKFAQNSAQDHIRHFAVELIVVILKKVEFISASKREKLLNFIMTRWEDPSTWVGSQIEGMIDSLFESDRNMTMKGIFEKELTEKFWKDFVTSILKSDWNRRGKYPLLNSLLKNFGAMPMLDIEPDLQIVVIKAQATMRYMGRYPADFLREFWTSLWIELRQEKSSPYALKYLNMKDTDLGGKLLETAFFDTTIPSLIQGLTMDYNYGGSERVSQYIVPIYIKVQKDVSLAVNKILQRLQTLKLEDRLCCIPVILAVARSTGKFAVTFSDDLCLLLSQALDCHLTVARIGVVQLLGNHIAQTEPIDEKELILFLKAVQIFQSPDLPAAEKSKFCHAAKKFINRLAESLRSAKVEGSWWIRLNKSTRDDAKRIREKYIDMCQTYLSKIYRSLISTLTPGVSSYRRSSCFEILSVISSEIDISLILELDSSFDARTIFEILVVCLMDSFDQTRVLISTVLSRFPIERLKGNDALVLQYFKFALANLDTPKYRESDSAASIIRFIFGKYVQVFGWNLEKYFSAFEKDNCIAYAIEPCDATFLYLEASLEMLRCKNQKGKANITDACASGFLQGPCLMLNYVLQECDFIKLVNYSRERWNSFVAKLFNMLSESIDIAIKGVAFHEPNINAYAFVEHNSDLVEFSDERQKFVTSCFLSVKELCNCFSILTEKAIVNESYNILELEQINRVSSIFEHILCNTRHAGVIDCASTIYQRVAVKLLTCRNQTWQSLPQRKLESVLVKALNGDLYVLRRSAGLTFFVTATLRASHSKASNPMLKCFLNKLIENVIIGIDAEQSLGISKEVPGLAVDRNLISISHSLNILRSVFQDAVLAESSSPYVGNGFECAVKAFRSESWLIRNSATLLFTALVRRGVGPLPERNDKYMAKGCSANKFFSIYPETVRHFIQDLKRSVSSNGVITCQPSLVPILNLLATFSPALITVSNPNEELSELLDLVISCLQSSDDGIRRFASSAAFALIRKEEMFTWCFRVAKNLPYQQRIQHRSNVDGEWKLSKPYPKEMNVGGSEVNYIDVTDKFLIQSHRGEIRHNHLNGILELLNTILQNSLDFNVVNQNRDFYTELSKELLPKCWLMSCANRCFVIQGMFFNAISLLMKHFCRTDLLTRSDTLPPKFEELIKISVNYALIAIKSSSRNQYSGDIGRDVMLVYASSVLFMDFQFNFLASNLSDMSYIDNGILSLIDNGEAVASALLFSIWEFLKKNASLIKDTQEIMENYLIIVEKISTVVVIQEKVGNSTLYALLCLIELLSKKNFVFNGMDKLMCKILELVETCKILDLTETAFEFYGICMRILSQSKGLKCTMVKNWLMLVFEWSDETMVTSSRKAACRSLGKSGILSEITEFDSEDTVYGWLLAAKLLQDDDTEIRTLVCDWSKIVNGNVQASVPKTLMNIYSHLINSYPGSALLAKFYGQFSFQNALCGNIFSYLHEKVYKSSEIENQQSSLIENIPKASQTQQIYSCSKIFTTERNNFYFESSLDAQVLGCSGLKYLTTILQQVSSSNIEITETVAVAVKILLDDALTKLDELASDDILIASAFNNELVYSRVYSHLMNLYVFSAAAQYFRLDFSKEAKALLSKGEACRNIHPTISTFLSNIADAYKQGFTFVQANRSIATNSTVFNMLY